MKLTTATALIIVMAGWVATIAVEEWRLHQEQSQAILKKAKAKSRVEYIVSKLVLEKADDWHDLCAAGLIRFKQHVSDDCDRIEATIPTLHAQLAKAQTEMIKLGAKVDDE
jgi:hypothetical protein